MRCALAVRKSPANVLFHDIVHLIFQLGLVIGNATLKIAKHLCNSFTKYITLIFSLKSLFIRRSPVLSS